jgi:hypothetical protein
MLAEELKRFFEFQNELLKASLYSGYEFNRLAYRDARASLVYLAVARDRFDYLLKSAALSPRLDAAESARILDSLAPWLRRIVDLATACAEQARAFAGREKGFQLRLRNLSLAGRELLEEFRSETALQGSEQAPQASFAPNQPALARAAAACGNFFD